MTAAQAALPLAAELRPEPPSVETDGDDEEGEGHG